MLTEDTRAVGFISPSGVQSLAREGSTVRVGLAVSAMLFVIVFAAAGEPAGAENGQSYNVHESIPDAAQGPVALPASLPDGGFLENVGQVDASIGYYRMSKGVGVAFLRGAVVLALTGEDAGGGILRRSPRTPAIDPESTQGVVIRMTFQGSEPVEPRGRSPLSHPTHIFLGDDPSKWRTGVRSYREVVFENLYEGVDLVYSGSQGNLKYEFRVRPGADPTAIRVAYEGVESLETTGKDLTVRTSVGGLKDSLPFSYEEAAGPVACHFVLPSPRVYGFACEGWQGRGTLVIDPLLFSTFLGAGSMEVGRSIAVDGSGNVYVAGPVDSWNFPTTPGAFDRNRDGTTDAFVTKLNSAGSALLYSTFFGGSRYDSANGMAIDPSGNVVITGDTDSGDLPTTAGAYDTTYGGNYDAFVTKLNATGGALVYSTFVGGTNGDYAMSLALDASGVWITGYTISTDFPTTAGAFDTSYGGFSDAFVTKLNAAGAALVYSGYLGGTDTDTGYAIAVDESGNAYLAGETRSSDFPTTVGAFDRTLSGTFDGFVARISAPGNRVDYGTYVGGSGDETVNAVVVQPSGAATVSGATTSADFPTTPAAFDTTYGGAGDSFVTRIAPAGTGLTFSTYLGGGSADSGFGVALDAAGDAHVTGSTSSSDFPTTMDAFDRVPGGGADAYLSTVTASGGGVTYSTFLGGNGSDEGRATFVDGSGVMYLTGMTWSPDFPTTPGAFDTTYSWEDAFISKIRVGNVPPTLDWTSEPGYLADGLDPESGTTLTSFAYRVAYWDADNDAPSRIEVVVERPLGVPWGRFPMTLASWRGSPDDFRTGAIYSVSISIPSPGADYWYAFNASDAGTWAVGSPTSVVDAPDVVVDNPPTALASVSATTTFIGDSLVFNGSGSQDDFGIVAYRWEYGDGATDGGATAVHAYARRGVFSVNLTVWDTRNQTGTDTLTVEIQNRLPSADAGSDRTGFRNATVALDASRSTDLDGDPLWFMWVELSSFGATLSDPTAATPSFTPAVLGVYWFRVTVTDGWGGASEDSVNVTVENRAPIAALVVWPSGTGTMGTVFVLDGANSSDPDGTVIRWEWAFGDGGTATGPSVSHKYASKGDFSARLTVTDSDGAAVSAELPVSIVNRPPIISSTAPGDSVEVQEEEVLGFTVVAVDPDGDSLAYSWRVDGGVPAAGTASFNLSGVAPGVHVVNATVSDGNAQAWHVWEITVVRPVAPGGEVPWALWIALSLSVAVVGILAAVLAWRRKRRDQGGPSEGRRAARP